MRLHQPSRQIRDHRVPRRLHVVQVPVSEERAGELTDERRWREAGGPMDRATYACGCGMQFQAAVSTSVDCPHCGCAQAW